MSDPYDIQEFGSLCRHLFWCSSISLHKLQRQGEKAEAEENALIAESHLNDGKVDRMGKHPL